MPDPLETERRPWWRGPRVRLSLRALMIAVLVLGGWLGWIVRGARIQREAVAAIQRGGGSVRYDWEWATFRYLPDGRLVQPMPKPGSKPPWPEWLVARLGPDYFGGVKEVVVGPTDPDLVMARVARLGRVASLRIAPGAGITDAGLRQIRSLTSLESFSITPPASDRITAAGLEGLEGLTGLRRLFFTDQPPLADSYLARLKGLTSLQELQLPFARGSRITDAGLAASRGHDRPEIPGPQRSGRDHRRRAGPFARHDAAGRTLGGRDPDRGPRADRRIDPHERPAPVEHPGHGRRPGPLPSPGSPGSSICPSRTPRSRMPAWPTCGD